MGNTRTLSAFLPGFFLRAHPSPQDTNKERRILVKMTVEVLWLKKGPMNLSVSYPGVTDVLVRRNLESTPMLPTTMIGSTRIVTIVLVVQEKPVLHNQPPIAPTFQHLLLTKAKTI